MTEPSEVAVCPMCGDERKSNDAHEYQCPRCGGYGFDCCVAGNNCICVNCEEDDANES
jgi:hypothetical protein